MRLPRHSTVVAYAALFVALGGTATAAGVVKLRPNSVGSREIKNHSIRAVDLASTPITKASLREAITQVITDPATGVNITLHAQDGAPGPLGPQGPQGAPGPASVTVRDAVQGNDMTQGQTGGVTASCLPGERVLGGGGRFEGGDGAVPTQSVPVADFQPQGWTVVYSVTGPSTVGHVHAFAVCAA